MDGAKQRYCRKCLLKEMSESEYFENLYRYIENLPREDKVSDECYEERLSICKDCDLLQSGMCRLCGCYVELRAAMKVRSCPATPPKWSRMTGDDDE